MTALLHASEEATCPIVDAPDNYHFEMRCEDCDVKHLSRSTLGNVEDRYRTGRITQDEYEAYRYIWALLSPSGSQPEWRKTPEIPAVRRIARKLLRARGLEVPSELAVEHVCDPKGCALDDVACLQARVRRLEQENIHWRDRQSIQIREERLREQALRSAVNRAAWDKVLHQHAFYIVSEAKQQIRELIQAARAVAERTRSDSDKYLLTSAASDLERQIAEYEPEPADGALAELRRVRDAVNAAAAALHQDDQKSESGYCICRGCQLIRQVWDAPIDETADATKAAA